MLGFLCDINLISDCYFLCQTVEGKETMWNSSLALASWAELSQGLEARRMQSQRESRRKRGGSMPGNRVAEGGEYWEHKDEEGEDGWRPLRGLGREQRNTEMEDNEERTREGDGTRMKQKKILESSENEAGSTCTPGSSSQGKDKIEFLFSSSTYFHLSS